MTSEKLPAKYGLTSGQVITVVWEAAAQPGYRGCLQGCFGAVRCISPAQRLWQLGTPVPSQQPRWPPGPSHVRKVTRPCCTWATAGASLPSHGNSHRSRQPSRSTEREVGKGSEHTANPTWGPTPKPSSRGDRANSQGPTWGEGLPLGRALEKHSPWGLFPSLVPVLLCHWGCVRGVALHRGQDKPWEQEGTKSQQRLLQRSHRAGGVPVTNNGFSASTRGPLA